MGLFKANPEKQAKKEAKKIMIQQLKDAGRTKIGVSVVHVGGFPKIAGNQLIAICQGLEPYTLRLVDVNTDVEHVVTVKGLEWDEKGQRSAGKAAAGAIVGGVLTGGLGLIAGAAIGGKNNDNSLAIMTCTDGVIDYTVYFRADAEKYQKLASLL